MTTIYLVRHSEPFKNHRGIVELCDNALEENKKTPLSIYGEELAKEVSQQPEFQNLDVVWSSDYTRAMSTAKYFAANNNIKVNVSYRIGERIHGIKKWEELPKDFEEHQFLDENYKFGFGESRKEVSKRMLNAINDLLKLYRGKRILVVSHSTALAYLLSNWCEISYTGPYKYKNKSILETKWNFCESFKLTFDDDNNLKNIENITNNKKIELEVGFKLNNNYEYYKNLMKKNSAINSFTCKTHDIYWTKLNNFDGYTENEIKNLCIRIRICEALGGKDMPFIKKIRLSIGLKEKESYRIENSRIYKENNPKSIIVNKDELSKFIKEIESNGYHKVFDTVKIDYQYRIGNIKSRLQFQDIKDIGLILYYDNPDLYNLSLDKQRKELIDEINSYGFNFKYDDLGLDKLRTLYYKEEKYSKNQNG